MQPLLNFLLESAPTGIPNPQQQSSTPANFSTLNTQFDDLLSSEQQALEQAVPKEEMQKRAGRVMVPAEQNMQQADSIDPDGKVLPVAGRELPEEVGLPEHRQSLEQSPIPVQAPIQQHAAPLPLSGTPTAELTQLSNLPPADVINRPGDVVHPSSESLRTTELNPLRPTAQTGAGAAAEKNAHAHVNLEKPAQSTNQQPGNSSQLLYQLAEAEKDPIGQVYMRQHTSVATMSNARPGNVVPHDATAQAGLQIQTGVSHTQQIDRLSAMDKTPGGQQKSLTDRPGSASLLNPAPSQPASAQPAPAQPALPEQSTVTGRTSYAGNAVQAEQVLSSQQLASPRSSTERETMLSLRQGNLSVLHRHDQLASLDTRARTPDTLMVPRLQADVQSTTPVAPAAFALSPQAATDGIQRKVRPLASVRELKADSLRANFDGLSSSNRADPGVRSAQLDYMEAMAGSAVVKSHEKVETSSVSQLLVDRPASDRANIDQVTPARLPLSNTTFDAGRDQLQRQLGEQLLAQLSSRPLRSEQLSLQLNPRSLGTVVIDIDVKHSEQLPTQQEVRVSMFVKEAPTREMLEQTMPRLRQALSEQGLDLKDLQLGDYNERQGGSTDHKQAGHDSQPGDHRTEDADSREKEPLASPRTDQQYLIETFV